MLLRLTWLAAGVPFTGDESWRLPSLLSKLLRRDADGEGVGRSPLCEAYWFAGGVVWVLWRLVVDAPNPVATGDCVYEGCSPGLLREASIGGSCNGTWETSETGLSNKLIHLDEKGRKGARKV